ncbi:nucleolar transcription factor 1-A-like [Cyprinodon tularosa]|uniref:nucleolar transcription factor 1-A-like n=1 Tax=Cyprinodon tularosa TaxID=77115 RepID=UPI0018E25A6F|nr:nucleolar transcription factor 1-A-like [Cyprinodon tularosa]
MSENEMDANSEWSTANILKLIGSIRGNIPDSEKTRGYRIALSAVDWDKVAFPPYSPEECQNKWKSVMMKMRKIRSLTELVAEAEEAICDPFNHRKIYPEFPKPPPHPRIVYSGKQFSLIKQKKPELSFSKIAKKAFKMYDKLPDEQKVQNKKEHVLALKKYRREMHNFCKKNNLPPVRTTLWKNKSYLNEEDGLPKKPPINGVSLFFKEYTEEHKSSSKANAFKVMSELWKKLSDTEKEKYNTRCKEMNIEYNNKLMEHLERFDAMESERIIKRGMKLQKSLRALPGEPKMPSQSVYVYFVKDQMKILKETISNYADRMVKVKKLWQKLPIREKERYKGQIQANMEKYSNDLKKWFKTLTPEQQAEYLEQTPRKRKFLDAQKKRVYDREELLQSQPSDSEDEVMRDVSIENEEDIWSYCEEEDGEMFEMLC